MSRTTDTRITGYDPLLSPAALLEELPLPVQAAATVARTRAETRAVLDGADDRLLVVVGPCSVHDPVAARLPREAWRTAGQELSRIRHPVRADRHAVYMRQVGGGVGVVGGVPLPRLISVADVGKSMGVAAGEDSQPLSCGVLALHVPLGAVGRRRQLGELGLVGGENFPELGFRQRHSAVVQAGAADRHVLHTPGPRSRESEYRTGESGGNESGDDGAGGGGED